jgi:hypothetical protein
MAGERMISAVAAKLMKEIAQALVASALKRFMSGIFTTRSCAVLLLPTITRTRSA